MASACSLGCYYCGGDGRSHTGGCCGGGACAAPQVQQYDGDEAGLKALIEQMHKVQQDAADKLSRWALITQEAAQQALEDAARAEAAVQQREASRAAIQAREDALRNRQDQTIRDAAPKPKVEYVPANQTAKAKAEVKQKVR